MRVWRNWQFWAERLLRRKQRQLKRRSGRQVKGDIIAASDVGHRKSHAERGCLKEIKYAGVAELADALALGASVTDVQVQVLSPAPYRVFIRDLTLWILDFSIWYGFMLGGRFSPAPFVMPFSARLNTWSRHLFGYLRRYSVCEILRVFPRTRQSGNR